MDYEIIRVGNEEIGLVWDTASGRALIRRIYLPVEAGAVRDVIFRDYPDLTLKARRMPGGVGGKIARLYSGDAASFDLSLLDWSGMSDFSKRVLKQTCKILRGRKLSYGALAARVGSGKAARAVGTALAKNPFPLVVPCHRVVRSDGSIGKFGGGTPMKQALLKREGAL